MESALVHEIELYPLDSFKTLLEHEIHRSRRYRQPLALLHLVVDAIPHNAETQHSAEVFTINVLNVELRDTDIPCRMGNEFLVLMPATDEKGGRIACERIENFFNVPHETYDRVSFQLSLFMGMTSSDGATMPSSQTLLQQASAAMQHARANQLRNTVAFSEIASLKPSS